MKKTISLLLAGLLAASCASTADETSASASAASTAKSVVKQASGWGQFDSDGSGSLNIAEYSKLESAQLAALDRNSDGVWTRREYVQRAPDMSLGRLDALRGRFKRNDRNEDEVLDSAEASISIEKRFNWLDKNNNGEITANEFPKFW